MVASAFMVTLPVESGQVRRNNIDTVIVWAESATMAKGMAAAAMLGDGNTMWSSATATALVVGTELEGWTFSIRLDDPVTPFAGYTVSHTATDGQVIDDVGTALATALNLLTEIANAAYNTGTNVLTIADATDALGDWIITCSAYPPAANFGDRDNSVSGFYTALVAPTAAATLRTVTLVASLPVLYGGATKKDIT